MNSIFQRIIHTKKPVIHRNRRDKMKQRPKEKEEQKEYSGTETWDSKCTVTFEEQDYDEHSGERGHELGGRVSIVVARDAPFPLDRNSSSSKHVDRWNRRPTF